MSNQQPSIQQIEGGRASYAFQEVQKAVNQLSSSEKIKLYSSYLKRLPSMIQVNGLGQSMAFYFSKGKENQYDLIYQSISNWIMNKPELQMERNKDFLGELVSLNSEQYRRVTTEVHALLNWMRKFATGMCSEQEQRPGEQDS
ncbi:type III-B CRISPR module-associated protein Cmr5 [Paenibacillus amylolyticus]|uniref:type III-B CRISPR module-associated protein Cmr5 n=2 Tax=Paenibacillus TaxID=44249 RepID=UPI00201E5FD7|nr:type III-B CRISPR module-associated protein Cmr5 [Paenibacillus amylolyticus]MCL6663373.1 type III-B CRISPR module-associated protein Cmr5 [Paenibacillus amylolyticus]